MKEIIIDGVNVAECRFLDEWKHCDICEKLCDGKCLIVKDIECKTYDDCYYKQLKRLEQENETLKEKFKNVAELFDWQAEKLEKIQQVCKEAPMLDTEFSLRIMEIIGGNNEQK